MNPPIKLADVEPPHLRELARAVRRRREAVARGAKTATADKDWASNTGAYVLQTWQAVVRDAFVDIPTTTPVPREATVVSMMPDWSAIGAGLPRFRGEQYKRRKAILTAPRLHRPLLWVASLAAATAAGATAAALVPEIGRNGQSFLFVSGMCTATLLLIVWVRGRTLQSLRD